jgi:hypothetical protein
MTEHKSDKTTDLDFMNKYLKYKTKYLELKKILPDKNINNNNDDKPNNQIQKGGSFFYEQNDLIKRINLITQSKKFKKDLYQFSSIYFKTNLTNENIIKKYGKIRKTMLKNNTPPPFNYHLTMLILEVNLDYPLISNSISYFDKASNRKKVRKTLSFLDPEEIKSSFETIFKNVVLESMEHEVVGKLKKVKLDGQREINTGVKNEEQDDCIKYPGWYFVDKFDVNNKNLITTFRTKIYEKLNEFMKFEFMKLGGKTKDYVGYRVESEIDPDYILLFYDNFSKDIPLMAIKKFYYGKNTWMPHITIFNTDELILNNQKFLEKYIVNFLTNKNRELSNQLIFDELKKSSQVKELMKKSNRTKLTINDIEFELQV